MGKVSRIGLSLVLASSFAFGDIYNLTVENATTNQSFNFGSSNLIDTIEAFNEVSLSQKLPSYNQNTDNINA